MVAKSVARHNHKVAKSVARHSTTWLLRVVHEQFNGTIAVHVGCCFYRVMISHGLCTLNVHRITNRIKIYIWLRQTEFKFGNGVLMNISCSVC